MGQKRWDLYVYGDVNIDLVIPEIDSLPPPGQERFVKEMKTFIGGGAALFALGAGRLGVKTVFQGEIGGDIYREFLLGEFKKNGVDTSLIKIKEKEKTGISLCFTGEKDRSFLSYRGTNEKISVENIDNEQVKNADHIHVTGYAGSGNHDAYFHFLKKLKEETDVTVSFDLGWDDTGEWKKEIYEIFPFVDVLFMNETEAIHYSRKKTVKEAAEDFSEHCGMAVIKCGEKGAIAYQDDISYEVPPFSVKAVDTTGAGDSFNAGFIYGFLNGKKIEKSLLFANACGALSVTAFGGNTAFPNEKELKRFIEDQQKERIL